MDLSQRAQMKHHQDITFRHTHMDLVNFASIEPKSGPGDNLMGLLPCLAKPCSC